MHKVMPSKICAFKVHSLVTKTKSWKNTAAIELFDFEFSKLRLWGNQILLLKNSLSEENAECLFVAFELNWFLKK